METSSRSITAATSSSLPVGSVFRLLWDLLELGPLWLLWLLVHFDRLSLGLPIFLFDKGLCSKPQLVGLNFVYHKLETGNDLGAADSWLLRLSQTLRQQSNWKRNTSKQRVEMTRADDKFLHCQLSKSRQVNKRDIYFHKISLAIYHIKFYTI